MKLATMAVMLPMLALVPTAAQAGTKCSSTVFVDTVNRSARGALGSVRNSADGVQNLSCIAYSFGYVFCSARDSAGATMSCGTSDPAYLNAVQAMTADSYVYFIADTAGTCTYLVTQAGSCYEPKQP